jgi:hypothetical protein
MKTTTSQMWLKELELFEKEYDNYKRKRENLLVPSVKQDIKVKKIMKLMKK